MRGLRGVVFFLFAAVAVITWAQAPVGNISGVVMDPSGAFIPGATVRATSIFSGGVRTANANEQGYFLISTLQPGEYKVGSNTRGSRTTPPRLSPLRWDRRHGWM